MISVISSEIVQNDPQPDNRNAITEAHHLDDGSIYYVYYLAEPGDDVNQRMLDRIPQLDIDLNGDNNG